MKSTPPTRKPARARERFLNVRLRASVKDPVALLKHARSLWEEEGRPISTAPSTVEDALRVALVELPNGDRPEEFGVAMVDYNCATAASVFERDNAAAMARLGQEEAKRFRRSENLQRFLVKVGADYHKAATVEIMAASVDEAESKARQQIGEFDLRPVERVEGSEFAVVVSA